MSVEVNKLYKTTGIMSVHHKAVGANGYINIPEDTPIFILESRQDNEYDRYWNVKLLSEYGIHFRRMYESWLEEI